MPRSLPLVATLLLSLFATGCGKQPRLTTGNYDKIFEGMTLKEAQSVLGKGYELMEESKRPPGGSFGAAAGGIDLPSDPNEGKPVLLPKISFANRARVWQWEDGNRVVQIMFINDKVKVKEKKGF